MEKNKYEKNNRAFVVGFAAVLMGAISAVPLAVASLFIPPMVAKIGSSVTAVSLFASISALAGMLTSFLLGTLLKKIKFKSLIVVGGIFSGLLMISIGLSTSLPIIYAAAFMQGIGLIIAGSAMTQTVISKWFIEKRGIMMAMILVFTMLLAAILNVVLSSLIVYAGYQPVALWLGIVSTVIVVILGLFLIVESPEEVGLKPYGYRELTEEEKQNAAAAAEAKAKSGLVNFTLKQAMTTFPFWAILVYKVITTTAAQAIANQASNFYQSIGVSAVSAGTVIAVNALVGMVFCILAGIFADKKGPTFSAVFTAGAGAIAFLLAFLWSGMGGAIIAAVFFAGTMATSLYGPTMLTRLYGTKEAGGILGFNNAAGNLGSLLGPVIAASFYDRFGNYTLGFEIIGIACVIAIILAVIAGSKKSADALKARQAELENHPT